MPRIEAAYLEVFAMLQDRERTALQGYLEAEAAVDYAQYMFGYNDARSEAARIMRHRASARWTEAQETVSAALSINGG